MDCPSIFRNVNYKPPSPVIEDKISEQEELDETRRAFVEDPFTVKLCICCQRSVKFRIKQRSASRKKTKKSKKLPPEETDRTRLVEKVGA